MVETIYILGAGSIGMSLAVHLVNHGRKVIALRTSTDEFNKQTIQATIHDGKGRTFTAPIEMASLSKLRTIAGIAIVAAKSYANALIASKLTEMEIMAPLVIMQNGIGVEDPYLALGDQSIYRCVLYTTGQKGNDSNITFRPIAASRVGIVRGNQEELELLVDRLNTEEFPFCIDSDIQREVWKKTIQAVENAAEKKLELELGSIITHELARNEA